MFGLGRKDSKGKQVRLEHRGRNLRASRTGGLSARAESRIGPVNATINTAKGVRLSTRVARGTHVALQRGRFRLQGRWNAGPLGFNLSKSGASASLRTAHGSFNFLKPRYSSFKLAGVQVRGKNAVYMHIAMLLMTALVVIGAVLVRAAIFAGWLVFLVLAWAFDVLRGFVNGALAASEPEPRETPSD
ncbi:MAG: hypothetical protein ACXIUO_02265 [Erythrobacter sp.]